MDLLTHLFQGRGRELPHRSEQSPAGEELFFYTRPVVLSTLLQNIGIKGSVQNFSNGVKDYNQNTIHFSLLFRSSNDTPASGKKNVCELKKSKFNYCKDKNSLKLSLIE